MWVVWGAVDMREENVYHILAPQVLRNFTNFLRMEDTFLETSGIFNESKNLDLKTSEQKEMPETAQWIFQLQVAETSAYTLPGHPFYKTNPHRFFDSSDPRI